VIPKFGVEVAMLSKRKLVTVTCAALCLYVGSFLLFRAFPHKFSLAHPDTPQHDIVTFTDNVEVHAALRWFYWPLIQVMPGHRFYPTRDELQQVQHAAREFQIPEIRPAEPLAAPDRGGR